MTEIKKYRPSNGTDGDIFMVQWCGTCARDKPWSEGKDVDECSEDELCQIIAATFRYENDDPEYPSEWTYDEHGHPCCTAWASAGEPIPTRCTKTADMFEDQSSE